MDLIRMEGRRATVHLPSLEELLDESGLPDEKKAALRAAMEAAYGDPAQLRPGTYTVECPEEAEMPLFEPSPHFNERPASVRINMILLHYTALDTLEEAIAWFKDLSSKVSAHYVVAKDGRIYQMVEDRMRAWHAGRSCWKGERSCNDYAIGIELVNNGDEPYTEPQYGAVIPLCRVLMDRYTIPPQRVLGHSDVSPNRKIDPGPRFDWERLAAVGVGVMPSSAGSSLDRPYGGHVLKRGDNDRRGAYGGRLIGQNHGYVRALQQDLMEIGYCFRRFGADGDFGEETEQVVTAFQMHYVRHNLSHKVDWETGQRIQSLLRRSALV